MEWAEVGKGLAVIMIVLYGLYSTLSTKFLGTETSAQTAMLTEIRSDGKATADAVVRVENRLQSMDDRHGRLEDRHGRLENEHYKLSGRVESLEKWRTEGKG
jgi:hypothetical protein